EPVAGGQERGLSEHRRDDGGMQVAATGHHQAAIVSELRRAETAELMARLWRGYERAANEARETCGTADQPPPGRFRTALLCEAIGQAASAATITAPPGPGSPAVVLRFGPQTDARPIRHDGGDLPGTGRKLSAQ